MKVITKSDILYSTERESDRYIQLNSCGINGTESEDTMVIRREGRVDFHFLYVYSGRCIVYRKDSEIRLSSGDMAVFYPMQEQRYYFEKTKENKVYWAHFTGAAAKELLGECGFCEGEFYRIGCSDALISHLDNMIAEYRMKDTHTDMLCHAFLHMALAEMGRLSGEGGYTDEKRELILHIATKMESNLKNSERIDDYAAECNLSRDRFVHLFKDITGCSPYRYMMNIRIEKAQRLLRFSCAPISEIAITLGFDDPLYFSRIFKKHVGVSPAEYRNKIKNPTL